MTRFLGACVMAAMAQVASAADKVAADPLAAVNLWRVFGSLGLILMLIFALMWAIRRSGAIAQGPNRHLKVLESVSLGQRERLVLVSVGDAQVVIGVAPGRVQAVHVLNHPLDSSTADGGSFAEALRAVRQKRRSPELGEP